MAAEFVERRIQSTGTLTNFNLDRSQPFIDVVRNGQNTRIYGTQEQLDNYQSRKPDGSQTNRTPAQTSVSRGTAARSTGTSAADTASMNVTFGRTPAESANRVTIDPRALKTTRSGHYLPSVVQNPLENFATMAPLWTLAVLTPEQYNNPSLYRTKDLSFAGQRQKLFGVFTNEEGTDQAYAKSSIVFSSAGRGDENRAITSYAAPEFYLDDFTMKAIVSASKSTGNTNAIGFNFTIYEPYTMGLLLQSLQVAALNAGYVDYLSAPFLLRLDFKGFQENGIAISSVKPKYFVMKLKSVKFETNEGGSTYDVDAIPFNHQAYADTVNTIWNNFTISPKPQGQGTVEEVLITSDNSLLNVLNGNEQANVDAGRYKIADQYVIQFPERSSDWVPNSATTFEPRATQSVGPDDGTRGTRRVGGVVAVERTDFGSNPISRATFGFSQSQGGNYPFSLEGDTVDPETGRIVRNKMAIDPQTRNFHFTQGQSITDVIVQVILSSSYAKEAVTNPEAITPEGYIKWFRLDVQMEMLDYDTTVGDFAKKYTFRVVPFFVHQTVFSNPSSAPIGYTELQKKIVKKYEYIYTGANTDVLGFSIEINNLFYTGTNASREGNTQSVQNLDQGSGTVEDGATESGTVEGAAPESQGGNIPRSKLRRNPESMSIRRGGMGYKDVEQKVAEAFHSAFVNSNTTDLVSLDLDIMGDTYWLVDSGLANNFSTPVPGSEQILEDGSANFEGSDVYIYIAFRTPADIDTNKGLYEFDGMRDSPFSGIYKVTRCESNFADGKFTQKLRCLRMQGQPLDYDGKELPKDTGSALAITTGGEQQPRADITSRPLSALSQLGSGNFFESIQRLSDLAKENGWNVATGAPTPARPAEPQLILRRRQSNGTLVNFNIDKSKPFVDETDAQGNTIRIYET